MSKCLAKHCIIMLVMWICDINGSLDICPTSLASLVGKLQTVMLVLLMHLAMGINLTDELTIKYS